MLNGPARSALARLAPVCARERLGADGAFDGGAEHSAKLAGRHAAPRASDAAPVRSPPRQHRSGVPIAQRQGRRAGLLGSYEAVLLRGAPADGGCPSLPFVAHICVFDAGRGTAARHALPFCASAVLPGAPWAGQVALPGRGVPVSPGGTLQLAVRPASSPGAPGADVLHVFVVRVPEVQPLRAALVCQRKHAQHVPHSSGEARRVLRAAITLRVEAGAAGSLLALGPVRVLFALREEPLDERSRAEKVATLCEVHDVVPRTRRAARRDAPAVCGDSHERLACSPAKCGRSPPAWRLDEPPEKGHASSSHGGLV